MMRSNVDPYTSWEERRIFHRNEAIPLSEAPKSKRVETEAEFHDRWAESVSAKEVDIRRPFEAITAVENKFILDQMGSLRGKKVLDVGTGFGEAAVYFSLLGAEVTALDLSPKMLELAEKLARNHGVRIQTVLGTPDTLQTQDNFFDCVYLGNVLHHIQNRERFFQQLKATLKTGGRFFSVDPLAYNPVINVYRKMASQMRTEGEAPLTVKDIQLARRYFRDVEHREFWLTSLILFLKYFAIDRIHPNQDRYWKRILRETRESLWWFPPLLTIDRALTQLPLIRYLAWNTVLWGTKAD